MKRISEGKIIVISITLLVLAGGYVFVKNGNQSAHSLESSGSGASMPIQGGAMARATTSSLEEAKPDADNVNHAYRQQVRTLEERIDADPADTTAVRELGQLLQDAHQNELAAARYRQYLELNPASRQVRLDLANVLAASGNWEDAKDTMIDLLESKPNDLVAQYNLGAIYASLGDRQQAEIWWTRVSEQTRDLDLQERASKSLAKMIGHTAN